MWWPIPAKTIGQAQADRADATSMILLLNDNYSSGVSLSDQGGISADVGFLPGDYLYQYARGGPFFEPGWLLQIRERTDHRVHPRRTILCLFI